MVAKQQQWEKNRHTLALQQLLTLVQHMALNLRPDAVSQGGKGTMAVAREGERRCLPMSSLRFTRLSPSATDVALFSVTSRAVSSRSTREAKEHSSQAE